MFAKSICFANESARNEVRAANDVKGFPDQKHFTLFYYEVLKREFTISLTDATKGFNRFLE